jgi:hypothetical protein
VHEPGACEIIGLPEQDMQKVLGTGGNASIFESPPFCSHEDRLEVA